jgi:hypothetical protein
MYLFELRLWLAMAEITPQKFSRKRCVKSRANIFLVVVDATIDWKEATVEEFTVQKNIKLGFVEGFSYSRRGLLQVVQKSLSGYDNVTSYLYRKQLFTFREFVAYGSGMGSNYLEKFSSFDLKQQQEIQMKKLKTDLSIGVVVQYHQGHLVTCNDDHDLISVRIYSL